MVDPVFVSDGHTYERSAIERWLATKTTSPKTGEELVSGMIVSNHGMRSLCIEWREAQRRATTE